MFGLPHQWVWCSEGWSNTHTLFHPLAVFFSLYLAAGWSSHLLASSVRSCCHQHHQTDSERACVQTALSRLVPVTIGAHTLVLYFHRFPCSLSCFFSYTHTHTHTHTISCASFFIFSSFIFMLECLEHVRFVYNGNITPPFPHRLCVFSLSFPCAHTHTDLRTRGWKPSGLQSQFNLAKAQREFSLPFAVPPPSLSPSFSSDGDREGDWGAEALIGSITAQMSRPDAGKSHPLSRTRPPSPCIISR